MTSLHASNNFANFSVLGSELRLETHNGKNCIWKQIQLHEKLQPYNWKIYGCIHHYLFALLQSGIKVPNLLEMNSSATSISFLSEFKGKNVVQLLAEDKSQDLLLRSEIFEQILEIIKRAQMSHLYFDPHIKNFVVDNGEVFYVDYTPPWLNEYFELRLSISAKDEKLVLQEYFSCLQPDLLGYHFASDLLKVDPSYEKTLPKIYEIMIKKQMITGGYAELLQIMASVREKENNREAQALFLL